MRITRHWLVAAAIAGALIISAGTRVAPGVFLPLLTQEFGWTRASIGFAVSIGLILYGLAGPFVGALIERIGTRGTAIFGRILIAGSAAAGTYTLQEDQLGGWVGCIVGLSECALNPPGVSSLDC